MKRDNNDIDDDSFITSKSILEENLVFKTQTELEINLSHDVQKEKKDECAAQCESLLTG